MLRSTRGSLLRAILSATLVQTFAARQSNRRYILGSYQLRGATVSLRQLDGVLKTAAQTPRNLVVTPQQWFPFNFVFRLIR